jgi:hypothetical protein
LDICAVYDDWINERLRKAINKKREAALTATAAGAPIKEELIYKIELTRRINRICGTVIAPWQIDELPEDWLDAFANLDLSGEKHARQSAIKESVFARFHSEYNARYWH